MRKYSVIAKTIYPERTWRLGEIFAKQLIGFIGDTPLVIAIEGTPLAGKTTFIQGLAHGFGVDDKEIAPKSLGVINKYPGEEMTFIHIEISRLETLDALLPEIKELFKEKNAIIAVEGANRIETLLPKKRFGSLLLTLRARNAPLSSTPRMILPSLKRLKCFAVLELNDERFAAANGVI